MFKELLKSKIPITDTLYLRYDINALIKAEEKNINPFALQFPIPLDYLRVGLDCCFSELGLSDVQCSEVVSQTVKLPWEYLQSKVLEATKQALPPPIIGSKYDGTKPDFKKLRDLFVDIMGRTNEEFLSSTLAEITERWNDYAVFNGYIPPAQTFKQFDD